MEENSAVPEAVMVLAAKYAALVTLIEKNRLRLESPNFFRENYSEFYSLPRDNLAESSVSLPE